MVSVMKKEKGVPGCQMTVSYDRFEGGSGGDQVYAKCGKQAKYRAPKVEMGVEFVCGVHARSLDKMYERIGDNSRCIKLEE